MPELSDDTPKASLEQGSQELTEEYIRVRAYHLFEQRGRENGHDVEDWLLAEAEITGKKEPEKITPITAGKSRATAA